ncbi:hypothetical protein KJ903_02985 [Patescibacteria group bacterium]|nr:hypothetical protein [Patescibacteria group bacterium]
MAGIEMENIGILKTIVTEMIDKMGVTGQISERLEEREGREVLVLNIKTDDAKIMIGQAGDNLFSFQYVVRLLLRKQNEGEIVPFIIDVNNYRRDKEDSLRSIARSAALNVRRTKEKEILRPMPAYDRRVVHTFLADEEDLVTISYGEEPERQVVIKLKEDE